MLRASIQTVREDRPFDIRALVLLPDHLHTICTLPQGEEDYSIRWSAIKAEFTRDWLASGGWEGRVSAGQRQEGRRGVWQPRFMEHTIRDEGDFEAHFNYIHYNPVKHGHVDTPMKWPWSTFHRYVRLGVYPPNWACGPLDLSAVDDQLLE